MRYSCSTNRLVPLHHTDLPTLLLHSFLFLGIFFDQFFKNSVQSILVIFTSPPPTPPRSTSISCPSPEHAWPTPVVPPKMKTNSSSPISNQLPITSQLGAGLTETAWLLYAEIPVWTGFAQVVCLWLQPLWAQIWKDPVVFRTYCLFPYRHPLALVLILSLIPLLWWVVKVARRVLRIQMSDVGLSTPQALLLYTLSNCGAHC